MESCRRGFKTVQSFVNDQFCSNIFSKFNPSFNVYFLSCSTSGRAFDPRSEQDIVNIYSNNDLVRFLRDGLSLSTRGVYQLYCRAHITTMDDIYDIAMEDYKFWFDLIGEPVTTTSVHGLLAARFKTYYKYVVKYLPLIDLTTKTPEAMHMRCYGIVSQLMDHSRYTRLHTVELTNFRSYVDAYNLKQAHDQKLLQSAQAHEAALAAARLEQLKMLKTPPAAPPTRLPASSPAEQDQLLQQHPLVQQTATQPTFRSGLSKRGGSDGVVTPTTPPKPQVSSSTPRRSTLDKSFPTVAHVQDNDSDEDALDEEALQRLKFRIYFVHNPGNPGTTTSKNKRRAHKIQSMIPSPVSPQATASSSPPIDNNVHAFMVNGKKVDEYYLSQEAVNLLKLIDPALPKKYFAERAKRQAEQAGKPEPPKATPAALPRQYNATSQPRVAQLATNENLEAPSDDYDSTDESDDGSDYDQLMTQYYQSLGYTDRHANTVIRAHLNYYQVCANLIRTEGHFITISDSGADSWVLGKGWTVLETHMKSVNLVGFDRKHARKSNLPTVNAAAVFTTDDGSLILGVVHHAVLNESSSTTLASEYQTRELTGNVVDSLSKHHRDWYGKHGKQAIKLVYSDVHSADRCYDQVPPVVIPLTLASALMTCEHRPPTVQELETLPRYYFTAPKPWEPAVIHDNGFTMEPMLSNQAVMYLTRTDSDLTIVSSIPQDEADISILSCTSLRDKIVSPSKPDPDGFIWKPHIPMTFVRITPFQKSIPHDPPVYSFPDPSHDIVLSFAYKTMQTPSLTTPEQILPPVASPIHHHGIQTMTRIHDAAKVQPYLGYRPLEVVRQTLLNTTQLATVPSGRNMRRHQSAMYPFMNRTRLNETVATDTFFSSVTGIGGHTCAQVFYGLVSHNINVYLLRSEGQAVESLQDFARYEGIPMILRSDNSKTQRYNRTWVALLRSWLVPAEFSEPHNQQQNPVELRAVNWLKQNIKVVQRQTGAPTKLWGYVAKYLAEIHNITTHEVW